MPFITELRKFMFKKNEWNKLTPFPPREFQDFFEEESWSPVQLNKNTITPLSVKQQQPNIVWVTFFLRKFLFFYRYQNDP